MLILMHSAVLFSGMLYKIDILERKRPRIEYCGRVVKWPLDSLFPREGGNTLFTELSRASFLSGVSGCRRPLWFPGVFLGVFWGVRVACMRHIRVPECPRAAACRLSLVFFGVYPWCPLLPWCLPAVFLFTSCSLPRVSLSARDRGVY